MNNTYKPEGYNSISPYIMADDPQRVIDFLTATFGATIGRSFNRPDGTLSHAELKIDDSIAMFSTATAEIPAFPLWLHVYVPDVDETYRRALAAGGQSVQEPVQKDDPDKRGGVSDPAGNIWWISTQVG